MNYDYQNIINSLSTENSRQTELIEFYQKELKIKNDKLIELEIANKRKSEFICHLTHDFKTPLNAINGFATLLLEKNANLHPNNEYCQNILKATEHLFQLLNYTLETASTETKNVTLNYQTFNPSDVITEVLCVLNGKLKEKNINLDVQLTNFVIQADKRRFKQLIYNLVGNAYKFNKFEGKINIKTSLVKNSFYFEITDTGCGISAENESKVFEPFSYFNSEKFQNIEQTGIGLSLCKKIINMHGGEINFKSQINKGTTFWFYIPIDLKNKK